MDGMNIDYQVYEMSLADLMKPHRRVLKALQIRSDSVPIIAVIGGLSM